MMENWAHINPSQVAENPEEHADYVQQLLEQNNLYGNYNQWER